MAEKMKDSEQAMHNGQGKDRVAQMVDMVLRASRGDCTGRIGLSGRNDDLDSLAMGLNMMIDDLGYGAIESEHVRNRTEHLLDTIQRMARGDYAASCELSGRDDSFDALAMGLNMMIDDIRSHVEELQKLNVELDQRVEQRTAQLKAANKELEAFAYSVSHDLRSPLHHIDGFARLLEKEIGASMNEKAKHYLETIFGSVKNMGNLIDRLLEYSRLGRAEMKATSVDLGKVVKAVIAELGQEAAQRKVEWKIDPLPVVPGDPIMLQQVFANLIGNAMKYRKKQEIAVIQIGCDAGHQSEFVFSIKDNGVGFDMQYAGKLFALFQRLHSEEEYEGTGIGLANVQRIVHRHGGRIWAEAVKGKGATFHFTLPKA